MFKHFIFFSLWASVVLLATSPSSRERVHPPHLSLGQYYADGQVGKKFHNLSEALADAEQFIVKVKDNFGMPSLVFGISVKGKTIYEKVWGEQDLENAVSAKLTTKYRLASISKTFTSAMLGTLVDRGLVRYSDSVWLHISERDFPRKMWNGTPVDITIGQLADHTAGTHITTVADFNTVVPGINCTQMIHKFKDEPLNINPGSDFVYSNYGYQLLGAVIEKLTGKTYPDAMAQFFAQLELDSTYVETRNLMLHHAERARYYMYPNKVEIQQNIPTLEFDDLFHEEGWWPSGGLMSTVDDLIKYGNLIVDAYKGRQGSFLNKDTLAQMWTRRTTQFPKFPYHPNSDYGEWRLLQLLVYCHRSSLSCVSN